MIANEGLGSVTLSEVLSNALSYAPYAIGSFILLWGGIRFGKAGWTTYKAVKTSPRRFLGGLLAFASVVGGPLLVNEANAYNDSLGGSAAGLSLFALVSGLWMLFRSKRMIPGEVVTALHRLEKEASSDTPSKAIIGTEVTKLRLGLAKNFRGA